MKNKFFKVSVYSLLMLLLALPLSAQLSLPPIFSDNMVLQQLSNPLIWGMDTAGKEVKIITSWDKKEYRASVDKDGKWQVTVHTPTAGGPYEITIKSKNTIRLKNVLIGEVWFCSGQSNMEMPLAGWGQVLNYEKEIAEAKYPNIRLLQVEKNIELYPISDMKVAGGSWQECSPQSAAEFSATAYFFGRDLYQNLDVPIGLIHSSWGGTFVEAWTSSESLKNMPAFKNVINEINEVPHSKEGKKAIFAERSKELHDKIAKKDFGYQGEIASAAALNYDDSEWSMMEVPGLWEQKGLANFDGYVWFRKEIKIPSSWQDKSLTVSLGGIDDNEITYFNGIEVGRMDGVNHRRKYTIPANLVKSGKAIVTVRITDTGGEGGFQGSESEMYLSSSTQSDKISLAGNWKYKIALELKDAPSSPLIYKDNPANPTSLFNAMINPFTRYKIKGAIWYQGENNERRGYEYRDLFPLMINDWRKHWGYDFPFYFAQLANFKAIEKEPTEAPWAELREAQAGALRLTNTGMAVLTDIGDTYDIHPKNKQDVGKRLSLIARKKTYKEEGEYAGPVFQSYHIEGNKIRISFTHTSGGLKTRNGDKVKGFAVAGVDHRFHWADAIIEGDEVIVSAPEVGFPIAVRYGWADNPVCNLYNGADLPASPFRTDDWIGVTYGVRYGE